MWQDNSSSLFPLAASPKNLSCTPDDCSGADSVLPTTILSRGLIASPSPYNKPIFKCMLGKGLKSFQERCPLPTARTMHLSYNIITVHIWGTYGKRTIKNRLNESYGVSSKPLSARFLRSSSGPAGEKLQGRKLKHLESSRDTGRQRLPEGSRTTHIYNTIQMIFTYRKCSRSCEIWHSSATGNKKQTWKQPTHPRTGTLLSTVLPHSRQQSNADCIDQEASHLLELHGKPLWFFKK